MKNFSFTKIAVRLRNKLLHKYISSFLATMQTSYFEEHLLIATPELKLMATSELKDKYCKDSIKRPLKQAPPFNKHHSNNKKFW